MLNAVRKPGPKLWGLPKITGCKPKSWLNSPLKAILKAKNRIGYPLVPAQSKFSTRSQWPYSARQLVQMTGCLFL